VPILSEWAPLASLAENLPVLLAGGGFRGRCWRRGRRFGHERREAERKRQQDRTKWEAAQRSSGGERDHGAMLTELTKETSLSRRLSDELFEDAAQDLRNLASDDIDECRQELILL